MSYQKKDHFYKKAKAENYSARSVYKLMEIHKKKPVFRSGDLVLDLGCAPGSWSQYASEEIGPSGKVIGIDLQKMDLTLPNANFILADINDVKWESLFQEYGIKKNRFDVILSDMAPRTSGVKSADQARSEQLCEMVLAVADKLLAESGILVFKFFDGPGFQYIRDTAKKQFKSVSTFRPKSTRKASKELFFICR